jgi:RNA polymerase sigma-70 factor (ECF subfamily)
MEWSDAEAAQRARKGDLEAFHCLVDRHSRLVYRLAFRIAGNQQDAEDLTQETFLRAFQQVHRFDCRSSFSTWLYRICANCSLDLVRARKARNDAWQAGETADFCRQRGECLISREPSPERLALSSQVNDLLEPAMQDLSQMERAAFVLRHFEDCDIPTIANALGIRGNAAKNTIFRAVQKVRKALEPMLGVVR